MNNELLLLIKKHTDTLIEQTKTKPQETLEFKMNKQVQTFSFNPPINLVEEGKWLLAVTLFDYTISVFNITDESNSFSINIPGQWSSESEEKSIERLNMLLEGRSKNDIELHVKEVKLRGDRIIIEGRGYKLSDLDTQKNEILERLKKYHRYQNLSDMVFRLQLTYDEIIDILDFKYIPTKRIGYSLKPNIYQISDINNNLKNILPDNVKISVDIDEKKYRTNLKLNQTVIFTKRSFFLYNNGIYSIVFRILG